MISIKGLYKQFGQLEVLKGIDLLVEKGKVVVVIGPSGSGKTTIFALFECSRNSESRSHFHRGTKLGLLEKCTKKQIASFRRLTGMVFQSYNLFPHKTALQNVMEGPIIVKGESKEDARKKPRHSLKRLD